MKLNGYLCNWYLRMNLMRQEDKLLLDIGVVQ